MKEQLIKAIISYEEDIEKLNKMIAVYESTSSNITGALYNDLVSEIYEQIEYCEERKANLQNKLKLCGK